jgi:single-strand DNA-binding protein
MSLGINKVILVGTLGADPDVIEHQEHGSIAHVSLATNEKWKDKETGEESSRTSWHRISLFGRRADIAKQYLKKGKQVYFEGKLRTNKWVDEEGSTRYFTDVVVDKYGSMQMLGKANSSSEPTSGVTAESSN